MFSIEQENTWLVRNFIRYLGNVTTNAVKDGVNGIDLRVWFQIATRLAEYLNAYDYKMLVLISKKEDIIIKYVTGCLWL